MARRRARVRRDRPRLPRQGAGAEIARGADFQRNGALRQQGHEVADRAPRRCRGRCARRRASRRHRGPNPGRRFRRHGPGDAGRARRRIRRRREIRPRERASSSPPRPKATTPSPRSSTAHRATSQAAAAPNWRTASKIHCRRSPPRSNGAAASRMARKLAATSCLRRSITPTESVTSA